MSPFRWIVVIALVFVGACSQKQRGLGVPPRTSTGTGTGTGTVPGVTGAGVGKADGLALKQVAGKEEPATLVAEDRSRCIVTAPKFRDTSIGSRALCDWRTGGRAP